jgi:hypothetical protein
MSACRPGHIGVSAPGGRAPSHPGAGAGHEAVPGLAYALEGRIAAGLALAEHGVEQVAPRGRRGRARNLAPAISCLSEAYLLAGRLEDARQRAAQAVDLARQYKQRGPQAWALRLLGESTARQASPEAITARPYPWPRHWAGARSRRTATVALARCMLRWTGGNRPALR